MLVHMPETAGQDERAVGLFKVNLEARILELAAISFSRRSSIALSTSLPEYISAVCRWKDMPINRARNPELHHSFAIPAISLVHSAILNLSLEYNFLLSHVRLSSESMNYRVAAELLRHSGGL